MRPPRLRRPRLPRTRQGSGGPSRRSWSGACWRCRPRRGCTRRPDARLRTTADVPRTEVAVVFGAGLWDGGRRRISRTGWTRRPSCTGGTVEVVLVTGDNSREDYDEPDAMRTYLTARGVPDRRIVSDYAGFDTWDSCVRAKKIFGVDRAVLVSQGFHIRRAVALCRAAGVDVVRRRGRRQARRDLVLRRRRGRSSRRARRRWTRCSQPDPHFLGPRETGVTEALADDGRRPRRRPA